MFSARAPYVLLYHAWHEPILYHAWLSVSFHYHAQCEFHVLAHVLPPSIFYVYALSQILVFLSMFFTLYVFFFYFIVHLCYNFYLMWFLFCGNVLLTCLVLSLGLWFSSRASQPKRASKHPTVDLDVELEPTTFDLHRLFSLDHFKRHKKNWRAYFVEWESY